MTSRAGGGDGHAGGLEHVSCGALDRWPQDVALLGMANLHFPYLGKVPQAARITGHSNPAQLTAYIGVRSTTEMEGWAHMAKG